MNPEGLPAYSLPLVISLEGLRSVAEMKKLSGYSLLIVEDDPTLLELLANDFKNEGGQIDTALSGQEAIKMVVQKKYDFIVSDMRMPNGDGRFLASRILELDGPQPFFFLYSGFNDLTTADSIALGIAQAFSKPCASEKMIESIVKYIESKRP